MDIFLKYIRFFFSEFNILEYKILGSPCSIINFVGLPSGIPNKLANKLSRNCICLIILKSFGNAELSRAVFFSPCILKNSSVFFKSFFSFLFRRLGIFSPVIFDIIGPKYSRSLFPTSSTSLSDILDLFSNSQGMKFRPIFLIKPIHSRKNNIHYKKL